MSVQLLLEDEVCPVCSSTAKALDSIDFNKSCADGDGGPLRPAGLAIHYYLCDSCQFCFAPEIARWSIRDFASRIYNDEYVSVDPDYKGLRPRSNAEALIKGFAGRHGSIRHLDYGGGEGLLSRLLCAAGWKSTSYDPFVNLNVTTKEMGRFNLITAYEVFEHAPDPILLMDEISSLLAPDGVVIFSTLTSDGKIAKSQPITWWYAAPRNGHISLFSNRSLSILANRYGLNLGSAGGVHMMWNVLPEWANHLVQQN